MNPILALIITNIIWGAASPIFKFSLTNIPPFTLAFIRFFFAGLLLLPLAIRRWQSMTRSDIIEILLAAFFGVSINISFFFLGLERTESINAPIIASAGPVFLYLLSIIFLKEIANKKVFIGMVISLIGVLVIVLSPLFTDGLMVDNEITGNLFFIIATIGSVLNVVFVKNVVKRINALQITTIGFIFSSLTFLPFVPKELTNWSLTNLNINGWTGIIFGVFFSSALAYYLFTYAISKINAQEVGLFTYIDPVIAVLIAIPLVQEYPTVYFFIGSLLVFGGIYIAENRIHYHLFQQINIFRNKLLENK